MARVVKQTENYRAVYRSQSLPIVLEKLTRDAMGAPAWETVGTVSDPGLADERDRALFELLEEGK